MNQDFVAIDVETANPNLASICQIGLAIFGTGKQMSEWGTYVNPQDYFDATNISIHGITENAVYGAPKFQDAVSQLYGFLDNQIVVSHTHFDRVAIKQACNRFGVREPDCTWLDSARVARRTWEEFARGGYGLANICDKLGYKFQHHDAIEDAKAAGYVLIAAIQESNLDIDGWLKRVNQPSGAINRDGNPEGPFYGEVIVFTGALEITRKEAADLAVVIGCKVDRGVTRKTTILVVGDQDISRLAGQKKSSKHREAEKLISDGFPIRILGESDFKELVALA